ncbi:RNA polymerase sigma factor [Pedobacter caeni]|uniref:RNA polymerase sigma-70 factor, ECF subfamily n=1 Tax=Pedobacter caeni TaxID=288992 RepID=A0A1M4WKP3_9SPHI|nr:sigma-70 family RNA polymerase sigma factor [Pedobacter caeni]SHE81623.1 RNA polymerase sigma-70 factor, ECF subfamily [Pedobacter caeni]
MTAHLFRENSGKMTAVLSRIFGLQHLELILDIVQDTFESALTKWRFSGIPDNPSGWLMKVARNKALNAVKRAQKTESFSTELLRSASIDLEEQFDMICSDDEIKDSQLRLLIICCQPVFSTRNQIIITLHILSGFGVPEIANALLMKHEAVKKSLSRCKSLLKERADLLNVRVLLPSEEQTETLLRILYLIFNEGYKTTRAKKGINNDLCYEAIRLTQLLSDHKNACFHQANALLALMFFNLSRFPARLTEALEWLSLAEQDRTRWNTKFIQEGFYYLNISTQSTQLHRLHLEAIIASLHCTAPDFKQTNWTRIVYLYQQLEILEPNSPYIRLNRIIAQSYLQEAAAGIREIDELEMNSGLQKSFLFSATKADIYQRTGDKEKAITAYELALQLSNAPLDRKFLLRKIAACKSDSNTGSA